ncbi:unnamed protein product [Tetraodon nigroviridis]|uniref:(spotted green pufferfish) hypothetical protein n=1 Tax=Tetraodon nigroviridis TaxID=99883 RepID=Q4RXK7_TETNG|nr:unnamed protein product [Tetraodon nigroviridis]
MAEHLLPIVLLYLFHTPTQALPPAKLLVDKQLISETDSVTLDCQTPKNVSVFQCYFQIMVTGDFMEKQCRRTAVVQLECFYTVKVEDVEFTVSTQQHLHHHSGCPADHTLSRFHVGTFSIGEHMEAFNFNFTSSYIRWSRLRCRPTLTPWLPTQAQAQTQTQGKGSGPFHPASSWSPAGWTLAHTDGFLTGGAASDERDEEPKNKDRAAWLSMVIAVAFFGVTVGVILLALDTQNWGRRRRSEHQNIEDEYHMYSVITEMAPSVKKNVIYSKVEAQ